MGCRTYENLCSHRNALNPPLKQTFRHIHPTVGLVTCVGLWNGHANGHRGVNTQKTVRANDDLMERPLNPPLNRESAEVCAVRQMCLKAKTLKSARGSVSVCNCFLNDDCGADKVRMRVRAYVNKKDSATKETDARSCTPNAMTPHHDAGDNPTQKADGRPQAINSSRKTEDKKRLEHSKSPREMKQKLKHEKKKRQGESSVQQNTRAKS